MTVNLTQIEDINRRIEENNRRHTQTRERARVLKESLVKSLEQFNRKYGTDYQYSDQLAQQLRTRSQRCENELQDQLNLATQALELIESGQVAQAEALLGHKASGVSEAQTLEPTLDEGINIAEALHVELEAPTPEVKTPIDDSARLVHDLGSILSGSDFEVDSVPTGSLGSEWDLGTLDLDNL